MIRFAYAHEEGFLLLLHCYMCRKLKLIVLTFAPSRLDSLIMLSILITTNKQIGFWDAEADGIHFCPQENRRTLCPHKLSDDDPRYVPYTETAVKDMKAILEVYFTHSNTYLYLR